MPCISSSLQASLSTWKWLACGHLVAHKRLVGRARAYWQGTYSASTSQAQLGSEVFILLLLWQKTTGSHPTSSLFIWEKNNFRMATKGKICLGTHGPTCALSGQWYCQERCGIWPKSLSAPTKHAESSIMRWQKWSRVFVMMWLSAVMYGMSTQSCSGMTVSVCQRAGYMTRWQAILVSMTDHAFITSSEMLSKYCLTTAKYHHLIGVIKTFSEDNNEVALWITRKSSTEAWEVLQGRKQTGKYKKQVIKINHFLLRRRSWIMKEIPSSWSAGPLAAE